MQPIKYFQQGGASQRYLDPQFASQLGYSDPYSGYGDYDYYDDYEPLSQEEYDQH